MGLVRRTFGFIVLLVSGGAAAFFALAGHGLPAQLTDLNAWVTWWQADQLKAGGLLFGATLSAVGAAGALLQVFGAKPVDHRKLGAALEPLAKAEHVRDVHEDIRAIRALLEHERAPGAPAADAASAAAESRAITDVLTSSDSLDAEARKALERRDPDAAYDALMEASRADRAKAAKRCRDAGALVYERSVVRAIGAYEQAASLDPADYWTFVFLSRLYQAAGRIQTAQDRAQSALTVATDARERSVALDEIGDVLVTRGDFDGALKSFRDGLDIARKLADADPANAGAQRDLSVSYDRIGDVLVTRGDFDGALKSFRDGLDIRRKLADADPANARAQRDLSVSLNKIGDVLVTRGDFDGTLKPFRDGLDIARKLADADPANAGAKLDLGVSLAKLGQLAEARHEIGDACRNFKEAQAAFEAVVKIAPDWPEASRMASLAARAAARVCGS